MGGANTEVTEKTRNIFLESAYFEPSSIRKTSKRLGLSSESSYRFERGTDIEFLEKAVDRAALLIKEIAGGTVHKIIDEYPVKYVSEPVAAKCEKINKLLGISATNAEIFEILASPRYSVGKQGGRRLLSILRHTGGTSNGTAILPKR